MLIVYDSKTGNVKRFVSKLNFPCVQVTKKIVINQPFIFITYTTGFGQIPQSTLEFLEHHGAWLRGVVSSGNMNWGTRYGLAADQISSMYSVPLLMKFELSGNRSDVERFIEEVHKIVDAHTKVDSA